MLMWLTHIPTLMATTGLKKISWSDHTVYTYAWDGNVQIEIMFPVHGILDSHNNETWEML